MAAFFISVWKTSANRSLSPSWKGSTSSSQSEELTSIQSLHIFGISCQVSPPSNWLSVEVGGTKRRICWCILPSHPLCPRKERGIRPVSATLFFLSQLGEFHPYRSGLGLREMVPGTSVNLFSAPSTRFFSRSLDEHACSGSRTIPGIRLSQAGQWCSTFKGKSRPRKCWGIFPIFFLLRIILYNTATGEFLIEKRSTEIESLNSCELWGQLLLPSHPHELGQGGYPAPGAAEWLGKAKQTSALPHHENSTEQGSYSISYPEDRWFRSWGANFLQIKTCHSNEKTLEKKREAWKNKMKAQDLGITT